MKRDSSWLVAPRLVPSLDPSFRPAALANRKFLADALAARNSVPVKLALEQADGSVFHFDTRPGSRRPCQSTQRRLLCSHEHGERNRSCVAAVEHKGTFASGALAARHLSAA